MEIKMSVSTNPLSKHFRQPQIYIKLPSQGRWYPAGTLEMPVTKELPVYAMTAKDELILKTPDALLNGQSTVEVIQSCVPNIKDAWSMPSVDLDAILIAIRQATYGPRMDFVSICPHCEKKSENVIDLSVLGSQITCPDFETTLKIDNLELFLKPQSYKEFNAASIEGFEQQRIIGVVNNQKLNDDEKTAEFNRLFNNLLNLTIRHVASSVSAIKDPDGLVVEDPKMIDEFFRNCERHIWDAVKQRLETLADHSALRKISVSCQNDECKKDYQVPLVFEQSSFFV